MTCELDPEEEQRQYGAFAFDRPAESNNDEIEPRNDEVVMDNEYHEIPQNALHQRDMLMQY